MKNFLIDSACNGSKPKGAGSSPHFSRPRLMTRLMAERDVARFLVAPAGFGKTMLALEYAESIFGFRNVHWIRCQSPCFLRDLDKGIVASTLLNLAPKGSLVVFEDVPHLDDQRAEVFSKDLDLLLSSGWEVLVSTAPAFDAFADTQTDRVLIGAHDLLLDDVELATSGCASLCGAPQADRIAAFVWGGEEDVEEFLSGAKGEELRAEYRLAVFVMLVLQEGSMDDVLTFAHGMKKDMRAFVEEHYPQTGLDLVGERFKARDLPVSQLKRAYADCFEDMARCSSFGSGRDAFACRLADTLVNSGRLRRACQVVEEFCIRKRRMLWIDHWQDRYLEEGQVLAMQDLFQSLGANPTGLTARLQMGAAKRLLILGRHEQSAVFSARAIKAAEDDWVLACHAALLHDTNPCATQRKRALTVMQGVQNRGLQEEDGPAEALAVTLVSSRLAEGENATYVLDALEGYQRHMAASHAGMLYLLHVLKSAGTRQDEHEQDVSEEEFWGVQEERRLMELARSVMREARAARERPNVLDALVYDAFRARGGEEAQPSTWSTHSELMALGLEKQKRACGQKALESSAVAKPPADLLDAPESSHEMIPELYVRLFGGMEVRMGNRVLDPRTFAKQRAKTLLAVLVLHRGKEIPRHELLEIMWPLASGKRATNNFYSLWSTLKKCLSTQDGECPYLVRHQTAAMVDARYVKSDIEDFEALCRRLFFEAPDPSGWLEVFGRLQDEFSCALLPSETDNAFIIAMRERFRLRLADAYVHAAGRLCDVAEPQAALWFAKAAFELERGREDAYYALMRAQVMAGQRTLAMETFHMCRDYLREELGIDPSERMERLYLQLINNHQADFLA